MWDSKLWLPPTTWPASLIAWAEVPGRPRSPRSVTLPACHRTPWPSNESFPLSPTTAPRSLSPNASLLLASGRVPRSDIVPLSQRNAREVIGIDWVGVVKLYPTTRPRLLIPRPSLGPMDPRLPRSAIVPLDHRNAWEVPLAVALVPTTWPTSLMP